MGRKPGTLPRLACCRGSLLRARLVSWVLLVRVSLPRGYYEEGMCRQVLCKAWSFGLEGCKFRQMCRRETLGWKTLRSIVCSTIRRNAVGQLVRCAPVQEAERITGRSMLRSPSDRADRFRAVPLCGGALFELPPTDWTIET